jgi:hypothetical protein
MIALSEVRARVGWRRRPPGCARIILFTHSRMGTHTHLLASLLPTCPRGTSLAPVSLTPRSLPLEIPSAIGRRGPAWKSPHRAFTVEIPTVSRNAETSPTHVMLRRPPNCGALRKVRGSGAPPRSGVVEIPTNPFRVEIPTPERTVATTK